jgi:hypothetical protein
MTVLSKSLQTPLSYLQEINLILKGLTRIDLKDPGLHKVGTNKEKNSNLDKFWRVLQWTIVVYFIDIWSFLRPFDIFYCHLVYFVVIWYIFPHVGIWVVAVVWQNGQRRF